MKESKGITLVALIITIIVMLILVAVSVNVAIKSNLIGTAEKTTAKYEEERQKEGNIDKEITVNDKNLNEYIEQLEYKIESNQYMEGITLVCVYTDNSEISFKYDDEEKIFDILINAGIDVLDIESEDGFITISLNPSDMNTAKDALEKEIANIDIPITI